jgi:hypothetical protein
MIVTVTLEREDFNAIHDVILEVFGKSPSQEQIQLIWNDLPEDMKGLAIQWGTNDTVFRDNLYEFLKEKEDGNIR